MKDKKTILFDLDGTIIDASKAIIESARTAMRQFGMEPDPSDDMLHIIGPPLADAFKNVYNMDAETAEKITLVYRELYGRDAINHCDVYEGIPELIRDLKAEGKNILLATSKPMVYAEQILKNIGLFEYFDAIAGPGLVGEHTKAGMIQMALEGAGITELDGAVHIGDRYYDVDGAKEVGVDCIGVLYGFGDREELSGATLLAESVDELRKILGLR